MFELRAADSSFVKEAPFRFENIVDLHVPAARVFDVLVDGEQDRHWFPDFKSCRWSTDEPHGLGSEREYALTYLRLREEFVVWAPPRHLSFRVKEMSLPLATHFLEDYRLDPIDGDPRRTRLEWTVCYSPNPYLRVLHPLLRPLFRRDFRRAAHALKTYLES